MSGPSCSTLESSNATITFPGGGIYFYWQAGCATYLSERYNLSSVKLFGTSAGSLTSALLACNVDFVRASEKALHIAREADIWERPLGLAGIWGGLVRRWLDDVLPHDAHELCAGRFVADVCTLPWLRTDFVDTHSTRQDVIDACMASIHIPFFMDGRLAMPLNGKYVLDGSLMRCLLQTSRTPSNLNCPSNALLFDYLEDERLQADVRQHFVSAVSESVMWKMMDYGYLHAMDLDKSRNFKAILQCEEIADPVPQRERILEQLEAAEQAAANELF